MKKTDYATSATITDPSLICNHLIGLKDTKILHYRRFGAVHEICVEQVLDVQFCNTCNTKAYLKDRPLVKYTDLPFGGVATRILWKKHRFYCPNVNCKRQSWVSQDHRIAAAKCLLTTRAAKWATKQVGAGRTINEVANELTCDWNVINNSVVYYGEALLKADKKRLKSTIAIGLDETLFNKTGKYRKKSWATTIADVSNSALIDIVQTRDYVKVAGSINEMPESFKANLKYGALDMSLTYSAIFSQLLPNVTQVVDKFHMIKLANSSLDSVRRRVQVEVYGHRGRKQDPLYKARKLMLMAEEKLDDELKSRIESLLSLGDPNCEVAIAYRTKEAIRDFYDISDYKVAEEHLQNIITHCTKKEMPFELQVLGRTLKKWFEKIMAYHLAQISNAATEGLNNLIKRIKRVGFGFTNFRNYRIRALLYAGKPNWRVLDSIVIR